MERKEFLETIRACRRRLNRAECLKILVFALSIGAGVGILFQMVAFVVPFYYANLYTGLAILLAALTAFVAAYLRRSTMKQAALLMDSFGFKERIVTAYEHLDEPGEMVRLQREDAMGQLKAHKERIRIKVLPSPKRMVCMSGLLLLLLGMAIMPSETKEQARLLHEIKEQAQEKAKEIEEVVEGLKALEQEALSPEQLAALQEMIESMQASIQEYEQATSAEMLAAANGKLGYKYENMSSQLSDLAGTLQSGATVSAATAESMQAMADKLQEMSGNTPSGNQSLASNQGQNGQNSGQSTGNGQNSQSGNGQDGSQNGQNNGQSGQSGNGQNGQGGGQSGDGQNGQGNGQSGDGQNGQGGGQNGQGSGSGSGRGEGSSNTSHDYVSIPNAIIDNGNLTGNAQNHDNSDFFRTRNGLSWEGKPVSYEAVIGSYEQHAYEGIAAGQYPSGMEDVIKEYFASFN